MIILCKYVATFSFSRLVIDLRLSTPPKTYLLKFLFYKTCTKGQSFRSNFEITLFLVLFTEHTKSFSFTVWPEPIGIKVKKSRLLLPQHQSTYPTGPESVSFEIPLSDLTS